jgi:hypothetical protein
MITLNMESQSKFHQKGANPRVNRITIPTSLIFDEDKVVSREPIYPLKLFAGDHN